MFILIPFPSLAPHGGTRVAVEIANRLADLGHTIRFVVLRPGMEPNKSYWSFHPGVRVITNQESYALRPDRVLITSPHSFFRALPGKTVIHLQMMEHMFRPDDMVWRKTCEKLYRSPYPLLSISQWNIDTLKRDYGRTDTDTTYIGNGVNTDHFPVSVRPAPTEPRVALVEGWAAYNPCKDVDRLGPQVARKLRAMGYRVLVYGGQPPTDYQDSYYEFYLRPSLATMNNLYAQASVLVKASKYDARACAPVEAMTKGCVTARAIIQGDDDLVHDVNCLRTDYADGADALLEAAITIMEDDATRARLQAGCAHTIQTSLNWTPWIKQIEDALVNV